MLSQVFLRGKLIVVFLFFIFSPFFLQEELIDPSNSIRLLVLPILFLIFIQSSKQRSALVAPPWYISILLLVQLVIVMCSGLGALNTAEVFLSIAKLNSFVLVFWSALQVLKQQEEDLKWALQITYSIFLIALILLLSQLPNFERSSLYSLQLFYEHKNILGSFVFILLSFSTRNSFLEKGSLKYISLVNAFVGIALLLVLQVRSVYLATIISSVVFCVFAFRSKWQKQTFVVGALTLVFLAVFYFSANSRFDLSSSSSDNIAATASIDERSQLWEKTIHLIKDHPIFGCGAGNWQFNYAKYSVKGITNLEKGITAQHPHNEVLSIWAETGTLGLILLVLFLLFIFRHTYYSLKQKPDSEVLIYAAFFVGLLVDACFSFPKERVITLSATAILLAHLFHAQGLSLTLNSKQSQGFRISLALVAVFVILVAFFRVRGEYYTKQMLANQTAGNARAVITAGKKAISPFYTCDPTSSPLYAYMGAAYYTLSRPDSLLMYSSMAVMIAPYDPEVLSNYGFALTRYGNQVEARQYLNEALRINPKYEGAWLNLVVLDFNQKKYEDAFLELSRIDEFEKKYPDHVKALQQAIAEEQMQ